MAVSFDPKDFTAGLLDDVRAVVEKAKFTMFNYGGTTADIPALLLVLVPEGADKDQAQEQYWSCGDLKDFIPSEDGESLNPVGKRTAPNQTSNIALLVRSMIDAGCPVNKMVEFAGKASMLEGADLHFMRQAAPKRGRRGQEEDDGKGAEVLLVSKIYTLPWDTKGKGKGKADTKSPEPDTGGLEDKATEALMALLEDKKTITHKQLPGLLFKATKNKALVDLTFTTEFLSGNPMWTFENGTITINE